MPLRFLLLEDNPLDADKAESALLDGGIHCDLLRVETRTDFIAALETDEFDLILSDYSLPEFDGISALDIACTLRPELPFIFISGSLGEELAIETLKRGATDYVLKQRLGRLVPSVQRALRESQERRQRQRAELMLVEQKRLLELIAAGHLLESCLAAVCDVVSKLSPGTCACVLLTDAQRATFPRSITPDFPPSFGAGLKDVPINDLCIGTCGEAVYRGVPITCSDIVHDERWSQAWRDLCVAHGIFACHSKPVMGADGVPLGSLMLCFDEARLPTDWEYQLADFGTQVASIVFERDRSNLALRESEAKYHTLFESIDEGFCICEMLFNENGEPQDYRFLEVNLVFERLTGLEQPTGKTARELVPALEPFWVETYGRVVQTGEAVRFERQSVVMNRWFDVYAFCIGEPQTHQFGILFTNISDRKQVEQEWEQFLAIGSDLHVITGSNGYFRWVSPTVEQTLGWTIEEITSRPWTEFVHPDDINPSLSEAASLFSGHGTIAFTNRYRHKDGSYRWLLWKAQPSSEKQVIYGAAVDITARKQAEEDLRLSRERLAFVLQAIGIGLWLNSLPLSELNWDERTRELFVIPPDVEPTIELFWSRVHPDDREPTRLAIETALQERTLYEIDHRAVNPETGEIRWIRSAGKATYAPDGTAIQFDGINYDISDRKQIEAAIQQLNQQLTQRVNELQTLFDLLPIGVAIAEDPECRVIRANLHMSELLRMPVEANASHSAPADERPLYRLCRDGQEIPIETLPMQYAAVHNTAVRDEVVDLVHPDGTLVKLLCSASPLLDGQGKVRGALGSFIDITQRVLDENALRQSEARFRRIFECNMIGMGIWTKAGGITEANDAFLNMMGYTRQDRDAGRVKWNEITPPEQLWLDERSLAEIETRGICTPIEKEYIHKEGQRIPILIGGGSFADTPNAGVFFTIDLSDRKQIEEALRQSESRFRLMVESAKEYVIFTLDLNGIITSWNSGAERLLGYSEPEAIGCNGRMIFTPEDNEQKRAEREMHLALTQGRAENERWHVRKDGSRFWGSGLVMPLQLEAGAPEGFVKIMQDKTAQRRADQRLHLLYETTRDLLATEHPMQLMDNLFSKLSSQLSLHFYYNYMVEEQGDRSRLHLRNYGGISEEAAQSIAWIEFGQYLCGLVAQKRRPLVLDRSQLSTHPNAQLVCSTGITAYAGYPLIAQGRLMGTLSFASLTRTRFTPGETALLQSTCEQMAIALERAELTASLQRQAEQLQRANHIKDEFLAMLSHELRSPLNPILGWAKLLQTGNLNATKTAQALSVIERNAKLQSELIEDLLDVSRILRGKLSLEIRPVDLVAIIQAAMETVRLAADAKSIQIQASLAPNTGQVSGDANRLQQVIWNLLSNAIKFTPEGGQVEVRLEAVGNGKWGIGKGENPNHAQRPTPDAPSYAQISVSDTGKGISPEFLPYVFDYFRQEDGATTRKFGGLGLGLAIVRHLVELHGGVVQVESLGEGLGATFTVKLPLLKDEGGRRKAEGELDSSLIPHPSSVPLTGLRILVVDDIADTREVIAFLLEMYGATVSAVASAVEAIAALAQFKADVLVSDIGMPDMDGYMLMQQIRALPSEQGGNIPAIALTAYAGEIDYQQAMLAGFQKHVPKPVEPAKLVGAIAELVFDNRVIN